MVAASPVYGLYDKPLDRESAYELLAKRAEKAAARQEPEEGEEAPRRARRTPAGGRETVAERFIKNVAGSVGRQVGAMVVREVVRGILGGLPRRR